MTNSVRNREIAAILYEMAELLELHAENRFKIIAYSRAARAIESLKEDIVKVCREKRLQSIPGVGKAIAQKVEEYLRTGKIESHQELLAQTPSGLSELLKISGLGPKTIFLLHEKLNITDLNELEKAAQEHRIRRLPRMGETREKNILKSIERYRKRSVRILYSTAEPFVNEILAYLRGMEGLEHITAAGSYRRGAGDRGRYRYPGYSHQARGDCGGIRSHAYGRRGAGQRPYQSQRHSKGDDSG